MIGNEKCLQVGSCNCRPLDGMPVSMLVRTAVPPVRHLSTKNDLGSHEVDNSEKLGTLKTKS